MATPFPARYNGLCIPCGDDIRQGDSIVSHPEAGYIHEECWDDVSALPSKSEIDQAFSTRPRERSVLPRGKTAKDRCDKCFIIHTPGQDGCE